LTLAAIPLTVVLGKRSLSLLSRPSNVIFASTGEIIPPGVYLLLWGRGCSSPNQTQRDTPLFEELSGEVTITDPTHPLYDQTLPLLTVRVNRSKTHVTVLLPTGRRRSVPRSATNLERLAEESSCDSSLPVISVRTILPLAHLVQQLKQAKEESHAEQTASTSHPTEPGSPSSLDDLSSASYEQSTAIRSPGRRTHSTRAHSRKRQGV
jgi:hypothetical protein